MQITMKFNHNGTHIEGLGFKHGEHRVIINVNAHDSLEGELPCIQHGHLTLRCTCHLASALLHHVLMAMQMYPASQDQLQAAMCPGSCL